ncbi:MAG: hypothetical protein AAGI91_07040 [Bacteroidota bacterium]
MSLETRLDRTHARIHRSVWLQRFTVGTRVLLAAGFIPPGLTKLAGHRFTQMSVETPIGYFFDAFFQAGAFYAFVGAMQVLAGVLLLVPRTATLGAVLYLPIITTISVITWSMGFRGTWAVTGLMTLACLWLLAWDYDRVKPILPFASAARPDAVPGRAAATLAYLLLAGGLVGAMLKMRGLAPVGAMPVFGAMVLAAAVCYGVAWRQRRKASAVRAAEG